MPNTMPIEAQSRPITNGWDAKLRQPIVIGHAPIAQRPDWLPVTGLGQANVDALKWSISVEQWIFFLQECAATETWKKLAQVKGEYEITMYDVNDHFVKPWTSGTGCSIALLMNSVEPRPSQGMLSHAWAGSVCETYNCLQNMINLHGVDSSSHFFYCTLCLYQPEDGAENGLTISEQLALAPFAKVIASKPKHGMWVIHTTTSEVYERLWVAHEADEGLHAEIQIRGLFDMYRWTVDKFESAIAVRTKRGKVGVENDRNYIHGLIQQRGGYARLDEVIVKFRKSMKIALEELLRPRSKTNHGRDSRLGWSEQIGEFDWSADKYIGAAVPINEDFDEHPPPDFYPERWKYSDKWDHLTLFGKTVCASPLGRDSYPISGKVHHQHVRAGPPGNLLNPLEKREEPVVLLSSSFRVEYLAEAWFVERLKGFQIDPRWLVEQATRLEGIFDDELLAEAKRHVAENGRGKLQHWPAMVGKVRSAESNEACTV